MRYAMGNDAVFTRQCQETRAIARAHAGTHTN